MKRTYLILTLFIFSFSCSQAQSASGGYHIGIGARLGKLNNGITFKEFFHSDPNIGIEAQLYSSLIGATYGYTGKAFLLDQITFHVPFVQLPLDFIIGGGFQAGYFPYNPPDYGYYKIVDGKPAYYRRNIVSGGIAANIGLEYQLKKVAPFSIGIDIVPAYEFYHAGPEWFDFGVDVRYVIQ